MNAYELANALEYICSDYDIARKSVNMLRQQADRIAELEVYEAQVKKIKSRKDLLNFILEDSVYPKPKPLSDKEIAKCLDLARKSAKKGYEIHAFARAIEERHGIK